jgi:glycosyltransferase involved in cell wall biosynthesis
MSQRRILLLVTDLEIGGTPTVVRELATRLHDSAKGVQVEVACLAKWGPVADQIRDAGVDVTALNAMRRWHLPRVVRELRRLVGDKSVDTVFSFLLHANVAAAIASRKLPGVRFLQSIQTTQPGPLWHWRVQRLIQRAAEKVVVPSQSVADAALLWSRVPAEKIVVIPNAVDPASFPRSQIPLQDPRPFPVVFIGRLDPIKQVPDLVSAVCRLGGLVHLDVWGEGPDRANIEMELDVWRPAAEQWVTLRGATDDPRPALANAGLLVLPSAAEGFGLVLIEAMAAGVPVLATNVAGIRDVVRDGETGLLVEGKHPIGALVEIIPRIVSDRDLRRRLAENGLAEVRHRFSWETVLPSYQRLLNIE